MILEVGLVISMCLLFTLMVLLAFSDNGKKKVITKLKPIADIIVKKNILDLNIDEEPGIYLDWTNYQTKDVEPDEPKKDESDQYIIPVPRQYSEEEDDTNTY